MIEAVKQYYDDLAAGYDSDRFSNSYGKYIHRQEQQFLESRIGSKVGLAILDLGCGTGRFLRLANYGTDISPKMIEIARSKFPTTEIREGSVEGIPFENGFFDRIFSFHVIMHLNSEITGRFLDESHRKLRPNGRLVFDFPSRKRRKLVNYKTESWHAGNDFEISEILGMAGKNWELKSCRGFLFVPIHRLPHWARPFFAKIDSLFCRSFLKEYASYIAIELEKK